MDIRELQNKFGRVEAILKGKPWFSKGKWLISQHPFPKSKPDGVTLHIFKKHWFNEESLGIHFESYLDLDQKKQTKAYVTLHLLHYDEVPGIGLDRKKLSQPLVESIFDEVSSRDGCAILP